MGTLLRGLNKNLTEQQIHHLINIYDKDGSGKLDFAMFHRLMAEHDSGYAEEEVDVGGGDNSIADAKNDMKTSDDPSSSSSAAKPTTRKVKRFRTECTEAAVLNSFKVFDLKHDGFIDAADLVYLLRELGEPLTTEDVEHLLKEIEIDGDKRINIKDFVSHMFRTSIL